MLKIDLGYYVGQVSAASIQDDMTINDEPDRNANSYRYRRVSARLGRVSSWRDNHMPNLAMEAIWVDQSRESDRIESSPWHKHFIG